MKYILLIAFILFCQSNANELKLNEINKLVNHENKKILVVNKSELNNYITSEEQIKKEQIKKSEEIMAEKKIDPIIIDTYNKYITHLKDSNKKLNLNIMDLLYSTRYVFENSIQNKHYKELRDLLLIEAKKYQEIDYDFFKDAVYNMNLKTANELINAIKGI
jgi:hypothetical protein